MTHNHNNNRNVDAQAPRQVILMAGNVGIMPLHHAIKNKLGDDAVVICANLHDAIIVLHDRRLQIIGVLATLDIPLASIEELEELSDSEAAKLPDSRTAGALLAIAALEAGVPAAQIIVDHQSNEEQLVQSLRDQGIHCTETYTRSNPNNAQDTWCVLMNMLETLKSQFPIAESVRDANKGKNNRRR